MSGNQVLLESKWPSPQDPRTSIQMGTPYGTTFHLPALPPQMGPTLAVPSALLRVDLCKALGIHAGLSESKR